LSEGRVTYFTKLGHFANELERRIASATAVSRSYGNLQFDLKLRLHTSDRLTADRNETSSCYTIAIVWTERSSLQDLKVWRCLRGFKSLSLWRAFSPCLRVLAQGCFNKQIISYKNDTFLFAAVLSSATAFFSEEQYAVPL
jgi:hypothetical protein